MTLTDEEGVRSFITAEQRNRFRVKTQPQPHCQDKGAHQLKRGRKKH